MSDDGWHRFNSQFRETFAERQARWRRKRAGAEGAASHVREGEAERVAGSDSPGTSSNPLPVPLERKT